MRMAMVTMAAEPEKSFAAEILDEARNEEEEEYNAMVAEMAKTARSPEAIAKLKQTAEAAVAALKERPEVSAALEKKAKPTGKLAKALKKMSKSLALVGEGVDLGEVTTMGGYDLQDPEYLSEEFRTGGGSAMCVSVDLETSLAAGSLSKTIQEQSKAKGDFPGPIPVFARAPIIDELQLAAAALEGAVGAIVPACLNSKEKIGELLAAGEAMGLEMMVRVCDAEELSTAMDLEAKILVFGDIPLVDATALLKDLPQGKAGPVTVCDLPYFDVRGAWQCRDAGFNALISGKSFLDVCVRDRVPPAAICKAILSKGSVKYGLGMQKGRLEGSKEFLGSLAM